MPQLTEYDSVLGEIERLSTTMAELNSQPELSPQQQRQLEANYRAWLNAQQMLPPLLAGGSQPGGDDDSSNSWLLAGLIALVLGWTAFLGYILLKVMIMAGQSMAMWYMPHGFGRHIG